MDLFIGRSGANTVYEIGILNKPAIFIPIPWVTHNEQYKNAKILQDLGTAKILPEGELSAETLFEAIKSFRKAYKPIDKSLLEKHFTNNALDIIFKQMKLS
jgi:UDP-N-acetylglucosamine--N-acetylmuramyl-(pentapeptide) pyrophosphoryl-undecaprenol N-acetylglucosamine transferase